MKHIALIGASGAIGSAITQQLIDDKTTETIHTFSRTTTTHASERIDHRCIDLTDESSIKQAADELKDLPAIDTLIIASGILHSSDWLPEKSLKDLSYEQFQKTFAINTIGPALVIQHFLPLINKQEPSVIGCLSARVGSISDNRLGGWYSYRASKAALNMLIKTVSIEMKRTLPKGVIIGLHPGTVDSNLSKPFQSNVPESKLFTPEFSAQKLIAVMKQATTDMSGRCFDYKGDEVFP